jgi:DNA-directed RNA polymerase specialized sigma24 family protein
MDETTYRARLDEQDWGELHARLLDFAEHRCGPKRLALAKDLAQQAILRVYAYDSTWDPEKEPDLLRYLMGVVNSLLWNERTSYAARKVASVGDDATRRAAERVADERGWSADTAAGHDLLSRRLSLLRERMADDPNVLGLLGALEQGLETPEEIRAATGCSAHTLLAVRRRMLRAAALVARDLGGADDEGDEEEVA